MTPAQLAPLFARDLTRLHQEIAAFPDDAFLWRTVPGISNSAGNLTLHLEGNLSDYIGRQMAGIPYTRNRPAEFATKDVLRAELLARIAELSRWLPAAVAQLTPEALAVDFPEAFWGRGPLPTGQFLLHLYSHFNYHLGQIDYLRRVLTSTGAIQLADISPFTPNS